MSAFDRTLRVIVADLRKLKLRWALVGGVAVSARSNPRFTNDFEFAIAVANDTEAEASVASMMALGYAVAALLENEATGEMATVRLWCRPIEGTQFIVDFLFHTCGIESEVVADAELISVLPRLEVPVATRGHLIAMKVLSVGEGRRHDADDLVGLLEIASETDLAQARQALDLMDQRGKSRDKDLQGDLNRALARVRPSL